MVGDLDDLVRTAEDDFVLADDGAGTDRVDADLVDRAFLALRRAVGLVVDRLRKNGGDLVGDHQSCAAGRVELLVVMRFDDLDVETGVEDLGRFFRQFGDQVDADRHVGGEEDRDGLCRFIDLCQLLFVEAGRADDDGDFIGEGIGQNAVQRDRVREVDDDIGSDLDVLVIGVGGEGEDFVLGCLVVDTGDDFEVVPLLRELQDDPAHAAEVSVHQNVDHIRLLMP